MNGLLLLFVGLIIRSTLLIVIAWVLTVLMQKGGASAAMRHLIWLCTIAGLFLLPLLAVTMPTLPLAILPEAATAPVMPAPAMADSVTAMSGAGKAPSVVPPLLSAGAETSSPMPVLLLCLYLVVAAGMLAWLLTAHRALATVWRSAAPADGSWVELLSGAASDLRLNQKVELRLAPLSIMPMTWGTLAPKIILPAEARDWSRVRRRFVLLHELAHVRRRDSLTQAFAAIVRALWWFHPGVWFAARQLRIEQELAADDLALGAGAPPNHYARNLLELACAFCLPAPAMASRSQLERRLAAIVRPISRRAPGWGFGALASSLILAATGLTATATPVERAAAARAAAATVDRPAEPLPAPAGPVAAAASPSAQSAQPIAPAPVLPADLGPAPSLSPAPLLATAAQAQSAVNAPFRSVESRNGAHVTVRYGQSQSVQVLSGNPEVSIDGDGKLVIDNKRGSHRVRTRIEVVTPNVQALGVQEGGKLTVEGGFPRQGAVAAAVTNGGILDLRRLPVDQVSAAVSSGGRIAVSPTRQLSAAVSQGGNITYWGDPSVTQSIDRGGVVVRGNGEDAARPF